MNAWSTEHAATLPPQPMPDLSDADLENRATASGDGLDDRLMRRDLKAALFGLEPAPIRIGRYEIRARIGHGGMGVVYSAWDASLDRKVAIKLLVPGLQAGRARFQREARALARLAHPNVVTVHEVGEHEGRLFIAMEHVDGPTLRQWLEQQPPRTAVLDVLHQAGRGLLAAHRCGLVHRDFKPDNVIVGGDGRVRILDFGLAKPLALAAAPAQLSVELPSDDALTVGALGTPGYIAPEQLRGDPIDPRTDQFAFCVVAHEALLGEPPFQGDTPGARCQAILDGRRRPRPKAPGVPASLTAAIDRGLVVAPEDRHRDLQPILDALSASPRRPRWRRLLLRAVLVVVSVILILVGVLVLGGALFTLRPPDDSTATSTDQDPPSSSGTIPDDESRAAPVRRPRAAP